MSYRKIDKDKYKIEVELTVEGERFRKGKTVNTKLKGAQLKAYINTEENKMYKALQLKAKDKNTLSKMTFTEFSLWTVENKDIEQLTKDWYMKYLTNRTFDYFGETNITKITKEQGKKFFEMLNKAVSEKTRKKLSQKTKRHYLTVLKAIMEYAKEHKVIEHNPFDDIKVKLSKRTITDNFLEPDEVKFALKVLQDKEDIFLETYFTMSVVLGLRPSEIRALTWSKINFKTKEVLIDVSLPRTSKGYILKGTKTNDVSTLMLTDYLVVLLEQHKKLEANKLKRIISGKDYVFTNNGEFMREDFIRDKWYKFCKDNGIDRVTPYGLRHTCGTLLAFNKAPTPNIQKQLRHADMDTTQIYIHATEAGIKEVNDIMESVITPKLKVLK